MYYAFCSIQTIFRSINISQSSYSSCSMQKLWYHQQFISTLGELSGPVTSLDAIFLPLGADVHCMKQSSHRKHFPEEMVNLKVKKHSTSKKCLRMNGPHRYKASKIIVLLVISPLHFSEDCTHSLQLHTQNIITRPLQLYSLTK